MPAGLARPSPACKPPLVGLTLAVPLLAHSCGFRAALPGRAESSPGPDGALAGAIQASRPGYSPPIRSSSTAWGISREGCATSGGAPRWFDYAHRHYCTTSGWLGLLGCFLGLVGAWLGGRAGGASHLSHPIRRRPATHDSAARNRMGGGDIVLAERYGQPRGDGGCGVPEGLVPSSMALRLEVSPQARGSPRAGCRSWPGWAPTGAAYALWPSLSVLDEHVRPPASQRCGCGSPAAAGGVRRGRAVRADGGG